jgi:WhiB family transcriptional regulator, redox-sensing transcriptional regulator
MRSFAGHGEGWISGGVRHYRLTGWGTLMDWEERAACKGAPIELFFGSEGSPRAKKHSGRTKRQTEAAKKICSTCPVISECRSWALEARVPFGILAGMTERERLAVLEGKSAGKGTRLIRPLK